VIKKKLEDMRVEEANIMGLMKEAQRMAYQEKTMSSTEYHKTIYGYENRLSEIKESRVKLRAKRVGIIKISKEMDNLKNEDAEILNMMKNLQREFFEKRSINKPTYDKRMEMYKLRKTEIEESLAVLETKLAKKERLGYKFKPTDGKLREKISTAVKKLTAKLGALK
ncbi:MAG: hypothetical protein HYT71_04160, partial [Candidatus Aenigmarchaeota archaeon]|nr:hypothetical protein [Candidatus Aenigmarchaeota archaeon]